MGNPWASDEPTCVSSIRRDARAQDLMAGYDSSTIINPARLASPPRFVTASLARAPSSWPRRSDPLWTCRSNFCRTAIGLPNTRSSGDGMGLFLPQLLAFLTAVFLVLIATQRLFALGGFTPIQRPC